jgi:hypothetical protein
VGDASPTAFLAIDDQAMGDDMKKRETVTELKKRIVELEKILAAWKGDVEKMQRIRRAWEASNRRVREQYGLND